MITSNFPSTASKLHSIAIIGPHADVGMISGGGSAQVDPPVGNAILPPGKGQTRWLEPVWFPTSPLKSIRAKAAGRKRAVRFWSRSGNGGISSGESADVAIVFAYQWESEDMDLPTLSLPENQDSLIAKVAAANPHTVVVLETGGPVTMPWAGQVSAILEAWFAGSKGSDAVANVLFGDVNPSAQAACDVPPERCRSAASHDREAAARIRSRQYEARAVETDRSRTPAFSSHVRRRREGRIQVVRRREKAGAVPLRARPFLHDLLVFRLESGARTRLRA